MVNKVTTNTATVSWDRANNAQTYEIRYRLSTDVNWLAQITADTFLVLGGLGIDKAYECEVRTRCNQNRVSSYSKTVWFNTASVWNQTATGDLFLANPNAQIGIGSVPSAKLHVLGSGLFEGTNGATPLSGAGTRLEWIASKSAFRAGKVSGSQWDDAQIGIGSVAMGENVIASGANSFSFGKNLETIAENAFSMGYVADGSVGTNNDSRTFKLFLGDLDPILTAKADVKDLPNADDMEQIPTPLDSCITAVTTVRGTTRIKTVAGGIYGQTPCGGELQAERVICSDGSLRARTFVGIGAGCTHNPQEYLWIKPQNQNRLLLRQANNVNPYMVIEGGTGNVGIGVAVPNYKLDVCGIIRANEVRVRAGWCDYVFETDYRLRSLSEVETYIRTHKHLPEIPTQKQIETDGLDLGAMQTLHMKKIEELTLYILELNKRIEQLEKAQNTTNQK